jgi:hypothetical protein
LVLRKEFSWVIITQGCFIFYGAWHDNKSCGFNQCHADYVGESRRDDYNEK